MKRLVLSLLPALLVFSYCTEQVERPQFKGYIGKKGFSVAQEDVEVAKAEVNFMPAYEIRSVVNGEDSLFITFMGVTMGSFKYFLPGQGLNIATFFDASQNQYYSTHLSPDGYGKLGLEQDEGEISGNLDLALYDETGNASIAVTDLSFHHLPVSNGKIERVGQYVEFMHRSAPNWSREFEAVRDNNGIHFTAKTSAHNRIRVEMQHGIRPGTYELPHNSISVALMDSTGEMTANSGSLKITRHDTMANYLEAQFDAIRSGTSRFNNNYELKDGTMRFTYWE